MTAQNVELYDLPPALTKPSDTRRATFVAQHGDMAVELDALPADVLKDRLREEVESRMDLRVLAAVREIEGDDRKRLKTALTRDGRA